MDSVLVAQHVEDFIKEWQMEEKSFKKPAKYYIFQWIQQVCHSIHKFFSLDKKMSEVYLFGVSGYELYSARAFNNFVHEVFNTLRIFNYRTADGNEIYEQLTNSVLLNRECAENINYYPALIPLEDGIYSTITWDRMDYKPEIYFTTHFNVMYTESTQCPEFRKFMNRILPNEKYQLQVFSYLCYCMTPEVKLQIRQIWTGGGKNGKTELTNLLDLIMGDFVTHIPMDVFMNHNTYVNSEMAHAWVNIGSELTPSQFKDTGITQLKRNTTNKTLRSEAKYDSPVNYKNKCKFIDDINETPLPNTMTDFAFFRRYQIIPFTEFITEEEREYEIMERIFRDEGAEIVRFLLSFHDVMHEHLREDAEEAERLWRWNCQSVFVFFDEFCNLGGVTRCEEAFETYISFCKHNGKQKVSKHHFGRLMKSIGADRFRMNQDDFSNGGYDYMKREYAYNLEINYEEADDIIRNAKIKEKKMLFLQHQEEMEI